MIFQSFNLVTRSSVIKNVLVSLVPDLSPIRRLTGVFSKSQKIQALEALDKVGILDKAYVRVDQLSGGQQQRVALARTLAQQPHIILADDFKRINQETDITILLNIHHVEIALEHADRIIGIRDGAIVFDGPTKEVDDRILDEIYKGKVVKDGETYAEALDAD